MAAIYKKVEEDVQNDIEFKSGKKVFVTASPGQIILVVESTRQD